MSEQFLVLTEEAEFGGESGAGLMRNRCAFTSRDMSTDWPEAFTYAVVMGWDDEEGIDEDATPEIAAKFGWDDEMVSFLHDAHARFSALVDRTPDQQASEGGA